MNTYKIVAATVTMGVVGCLFAAPANAGCGTPDLLLHGLMPATAVQGAIAKAAKVSTSLRVTGNAPVLGNSLAMEPGRKIVGLWKFTFLSLGNLNLGIPDGAVLDAGFQTWHSDGTEIMNSGRPPMTSNFCMGVWDYTPSSRSYRLNHYALSWAPDGTTFIGPTNIREQVSMDPGGNGFSGRFSIDQYAQDGVTDLAHLEGTITATRITVH
ncbi:MAG: hypothetical protein ABIP11_08205 [Luteimonas sp.]